MKLEKGMRKKKWEKEVRQGKRKGVLLDCLLWPSLHYITEMLRH